MDFPAPVLAFLDVGAQEMIVILVVALLIFGGRLPEVARNLGKTFGELRRSAHGLTRDLRREMSDLPDPRSFSPRSLVKRHLLPDDEEGPLGIPPVEPQDSVSHPEDPESGSAEDQESTEAALAKEIYPEQEAAEGEVGPHLEGREGAPPPPGDEGAGKKGAD